MREASHVMDQRNKAGATGLAGVLVAVTALAAGPGPHAAAVQSAPIASPEPAAAAAPPLSYRPVRGDSIVVFAAHPDDETLGAGGFIHNAVASGARVTIVIFTNGDGYLEGVDVGFRTLVSTPEKFIEFGRLRQQEALAAASQLGVPASQVFFLGYPDRGLGVLWGPRWDCSRPYTSPYTRRDRSPYPLTVHPGSRYCGENVLADVEGILRRERPAAVVMHHPADTHRDHWAAGAFVTFALEHLVHQGEPWAARARVLQYLIHAGRWPLPAADAADLELIPPEALRGPRDRWVAFPLSGDDETAKRRAVGEYRSQMRLLRTYMLSFVRRNDLFDAVLPVFPYVVHEDLPLDAPDAWDRIPPAIPLPADSSLSETVYGSADMTGVTAACAPGRLFLGIYLRRPPTPDVQYRVEMRLVQRGGRTARLLLRFQPAGTLSSEQRRPADLPLPQGAAAHSTGPRILITLPTGEIGDPESAYLSAFTISPIRTMVDRTPWTLIHLGNGCRPPSTARRRSGGIAGGPV
jgi:LmbE family N-acetylglucosaminyl deacetylase